MNRTVRSIVLVTALVAGPAMLTAAQSPQPNPEQKKLGFLVGNWKVTSQTVTNPFSPAGQYQGTLACEWFNGNFHVVCHFDGKGAAGAYRELDVFGFDAEAKAYFLYAVDGTGFNGTAQGRVKDNTWRFVFQLRTAGKPMGIRLTVKETSTSAITLKSEYSEANGPWKPYGMGTASRVK